MFWDWRTWYIGTPSIALCAKYLPQLIYRFPCTSCNLLYSGTPVVCSNLKRHSCATCPRTVVSAATAAAGVVSDFLVDVNVSSLQNLCWLMISWWMKNYPSYQYFGLFDNPIEGSLFEPNLVFHVFSFFLSTAVFRLFRL